MGSEWYSDPGARGPHLSSILNCFFFLLLYFFHCFMSSYYFDYLKVVTGAISPCSSTVVTASADGEVRVWDVAPGRSPTYSTAVRSFIFSFLFSLLPFSFSRCKMIDCFFTDISMQIISRWKAHGDGLRRLL